MKKSAILQRVLAYDFEHMTLPELKQYANINGINIPPKADRDEIYNIIFSEMKTRAMGEPGLSLLEERERSLFVDPGRFVSVGNYINDYEDLSIFTVCPKCGEEVLGKYYVASENAYKTDSAVVSAFAKCPHCKGKLGLDDTRTIAFLDYNNPTSGFKTLHDSVRESKREASLDIIQKYVDNLQKNKDMPSDNRIAVKILSSKKDLKKYMSLRSRIL